MHKYISKGILHFSEKQNCAHSCSITFKSKKKNNFWKFCFNSCNKNDTKSVKVGIFISELSTFVKTVCVTTSTNYSFFKTDYVRKLRSKNVSDGFGSSSQGKSNLCKKKSPSHNLSDIYPKILKEWIFGAVLTCSYIYCLPPNMFSIFWYSRGCRPFYTHIAITRPTLPSLA